MEVVNTLIPSRTRSGARLMEKGQEHIIRAPRTHPHGLLLEEGQPQGETQQSWQQRRQQSKQPPPKQALQRKLPQPHRCRPMPLPPQLPLPPPHLSTSHRPHPWSRVCRVHHQLVHVRMDVVAAPIDGLQGTTPGPLIVLSLRGHRGTAGRLIIERGAATEPPHPAINVLLACA